MTNAAKRKVGGWLIVLAIFCAVATVVLYQHANDDVNDDRLVAAFTGTKASDADYTPAFVVGGVGVLAVVCGVILLAAAKPDPGRAEGPAPKDRPDSI